MKNWKTTLTGVLTAVLILGYKVITHQPITGEDIIIAGSAVGLGANAKDNNVTGGTIQQ